MGVRPCDWFLDELIPEKSYAFLNSMTGTSLLVGECLSRLFKKARLLTRPTLSLPRQPLCPGDAPCPQASPQLRG